MTKEEKIKTFIQTGFIHFKKVCELAGVEQSKGSRWLNGERKLTPVEIQSIETVLKTIRYK